MAAIADPENAFAAATRSALAIAAGAVTGSIQLYGWHPRGGTAHNPESPQLQPSSAEGSVLFGFSKEILALNPMTRK